VRERKVLMEERIRHSNRIKRLLFSQGIIGYDPLRRDRREWLETLQTGDGRTLPDHMKRQILRELDRLEMLLDQLRAVEAERDALLAKERQSAREVGLLSKVVGVGPEFAAVLWGEGLFRHFDNRRQWRPMPASRRRLGKVDRSTGSRGSENPEIHVCAQRSWKWPGSGYAISRARRSVAGSTNVSPKMAAASRR